MISLLTWKLLKYIGLIIFSGSLAVVAAGGQNQQTRWKAVNRGMGTGFLLLWIGGYGMVKSSGLQLSLPWLGYGQLLSILCLFFAYLSFKSTEHSKAILSLSFTTLVLSLIAMIMKDSALSLLRVTTALTIFAAAFFVLKKQDPVQDNYGKQSWFKLIAWSEALSLIALLFIYMPLKYLASINLDNGQGWFGWIHGVLQIIFILALSGLLIVRKISRAQFFSGLVASMLPFGTILFDRHLSKSAD